MSAAGSYPMHDVEANGSKVTFSEKFTDREKKLRTAVIVLVVLICGLIIALILLATLSKKPKMEEICTDASCIKAANFLLESMNTSVDPCEDFYQFSCGKWIADHMDGIGTRTLQSTTEKLDEDFHKIFKSEERNRDLPSSVAKIIKVFNVCLKYDGLNEDNMAWIKNITKQAGGFPLIDESFSSPSLDWTDLYVKQFKIYIIDFPLSIMIFSNPLNSSERVIHISQPPQESDSELPPLDRDVLYAIAIKFENSNNESIFKDLDDIFWLKEKFSNLSRPYPELMEDKEEYQLVTINEMQSMYPEVKWKSFLSNIFKDFLSSGTIINDNDKVFLRGKTYIKNIIELFENNEISKRMFLNYGGAMFMNFMLSYNYKEHSSFRFKLKRKSSSITDIKRTQCKGFITKTASPALDYLYGKHRKEKYISNELIDYMVKAMKEMILHSTWLDEPTKKAVQEKLDHMLAFSGLPPWTQKEQEVEEYFKELSEITDNSFQNTLNLRLFDFKKTVELYRQKYDRFKWPRYSLMGGSQVNAFYVPDFNIVVIPAGIQQLPYYSSERPKYMNFGGMGLVYGHEMTHGLDESGSLRDKYGNLKNWWTEKAKTEFKKRSQCFIDQYSSYRYDGLDASVDGKQTLSENIADNGGIRQAFLGYQKWVKDNGKEKRLPGLESYCPEQLFFVSFAASWCSSIHPPQLLAFIHARDSHAADQFRAIGSLVNMKEFAEVFNCKAESKMNPKNRCNIW